MIEVHCFKGSFGLIFNMYKYCLTPIDATNTSRDGALWRVPTDVTVGEIDSTKELCILMTDEKYLRL